MSQKNQDWHRADIKSALEKKGKNMRALSREAGLAPDSLRNVLTRHWPKAENLVANAIGVAPETIWPSRYELKKNGFKEAV